MPIAIPVVMKTVVEAFFSQNCSSTTRTVARPPSAKMFATKIIDEHKARTPKSSGDAILAMISDPINPIAAIHRYLKGSKV